MDQFNQPEANNDQNSMPENQNYSPENPVNSGSDNPMTPPSGQPEKGGMGALIGSIIVIIILVFGAIYFWGRELNNASPAENQDLEQIENDLENNDVENLDAEFDQTLDAELGQ